MIGRHWLVATLAGGLALCTAACTDGYGYSGAGVGYGVADYGGPYGYTPGYYGWYNDYYYPGTGAYVYDRARRPYRWNDDQRRYWQSRPGYGNRQVRQNWQEFGRDVRRERRDYRGDVRDDRQAYRNGTITREQFRQERQEARREYRGDVRQEYRELRRQNRAEGVRTPRPDRAFRPGRGRRNAPD